MKQPVVTRAQCPDLLEGQPVEIPPLDLSQRATEQRPKSGRFPGFPFHPGHDRVSHFRLRSHFFAAHR